MCEMISKHASNDLLNVKNTDISIIVDLVYLFSLLMDLLDNTNRLIFSMAL